MKTCEYCGREIPDGEVCDCPDAAARRERDARRRARRAAQQAQQTQQETKQESELPEAYHGIPIPDDTLSEKLMKSLHTAFQNPKQAVADLVKEKNLKLPLMYIAALFAVMLGLGRSLYAKYGKNISKVLLWSMCGAVVCYLVAALSQNSAVSMIACVLTGPFTSMLWPGMLILMEEKIPAPGVAAYALMAAGGDFGASVAPQMLGIVVDNVAASSWAVSLAETFSMTAEQIGMKVGMLAAAIFPILGVIALVFSLRYFKKAKG